MEGPGGKTSSSGEYTAIEEKLPFLGEGKQSEEEASSEQHEHHGPYRCRNCSFVYWPFILLFQFVFTVIVIAVIVQRLWNPRSSVTVNSQYLDLSHPELLRPAVKYNVYTPSKDWWERPLYTDLSLESGMAWQDIMDRQAFRIFPDEINQFNIPITPWYGRGLDSGGFPSVLGVFHNLHCLRHIKQELFKDHYFPGRTAERAEARVEHTKHCLEVLRQSVMCNADLTPLPLLWNPQHNISYVKPDALRRCIVWDSLLDSTKHRRYEYDEIKHENL